MREKVDYGKVGVLLGGASAEREIWLKSGRAVSAALQERGLEVVEIGEREKVEAGVLAHRPDLAFIALHGRFGEDGAAEGDR